MTSRRIYVSPYHSPLNLLNRPYHERSQPPKLSTSSTSSTYYIYIYIYIYIYCLCVYICIYVYIYIYIHIYTHTYRRQNVGLVGQWLTCHVHHKLFPEEEGGEEEDLVHQGYVVILEDDMQVSFATRLGLFCLCIRSLLPLD